MYSIGEFSRITRLTLKALRLYHDKGILIPSYIDDDTGYRYYNKDDLEKARRIVMLKQMRCSLADIQAICNNNTDDADLMQFLRERQRSIQSEIQQLKAIANAINGIIGKETRAEKMNQPAFDIEVRMIDDTQVIAQRWTGTYQQTGETAGKLYKAAGRHTGGTMFNLYYDGEYKDENADIETCLPVKKPLNGKFDCKTIVGGKFVTLVHKGGYDTIGDSYARLFEYINHEGLEAGIPSREIYHKGPGIVFKGNPNNYLTEIQIPVL